MKKLRVRILTDRVHAVTPTPYGLVINRNEAKDDRFNDGGIPLGYRDVVEPYDGLAIFKYHNSINLHVRFAF